MINTLVAGATPEAAMATSAVTPAIALDDCPLPRVGTVDGRLGLATEADGVWQQIIPTAPSTSRRDVGVWIARQATAAAALREPERAVELTRQAVGIAVDTGSVRARRELAAVDRAMSPWQADRVGKDLAVALAPISGRG